MTRQLEGHGRLRKLAADMPGFRRFLQALAERGRDPNKGLTELDELLDCGVNKDAAMNCFREMQGAGLGNLKLGRRGAKTRFEWSTSAKSAARELLGQDDSNTSIPSLLDSALRSNESPDGRGHGRFIHSFLLRPDYLVRIELPLDLTDSEARRLAEFLCSIPFTHVSSDSSCLTQESRI